ncbi:MAG: hypothetical protein ACREHD_30650, partial [Pirellulales bacterium]
YTYHRRLSARYAPRFSVQLERGRQEETMAEQPLIEMYAAAIGRVDADYDDDWFVERLARCRAGDEMGEREISERHLRIVLEIAREECNRRHAEGRLLDAVQEGNAALIETIRVFRGNSGAEFVAAIRAVVTADVMQYLDAT